MSFISLTISSKFMALLIHLTRTGKKIQFMVKALLIRSFNENVDTFKLFAKHFFLFSPHRWKTQNEEFYAISVELHHIKFVYFHDFRTFLSFKIFKVNVSVTTMRKARTFPWRTTFSSDFVYIPFESILQRIAKQ